jgi:hypothetical protein
MGDRELLLEPFPDALPAFHGVVEIYINPAILGETVSARVPLRADEGIDIPPLQLMDLLNILGDGHSFSQFL